MNDLWYVCLFLIDWCWSIQAEADSYISVKIFWHQIHFYQRWKMLGFFFLCYILHISILTKVIPFFRYIPIIYLTKTHLTKKYSSNFLCNLDQLFTINFRILCIIIFNSFHYIFKKSYAKHDLVLLILQFYLKYLYNGL